METLLLYRYTALLRRSMNNWVITIELTRILVGSGKISGETIRQVEYLTWIRESPGSRNPLYGA